MDNKHAFLAPSSAHRWGPGGCPGSAAMEAKYPEDVASEASREGTAAHHYLTETLQGRVVAVGDLAPNGYPINTEMVEAAQEMLTDVRDTMAASTPGLTLHVERRVMGVHALNWGTPDVFLGDRETRTLHVWDYKYGHRYVDAYRNWQMINYAVGIFFENNETDWHDWRVTLTIAQPRNYAPEGPLREWYLSGASLREYADQLTVAAKLAVEPGAELRTGPHCRNCHAAHACPALQAAAMNAVDLSYRQTAVDMPVAAAGLELHILRAAEARLKARADAVEAQVMGYFQRGQSVPFWSHAPTKGRKRWTMLAEDVVEIGKLYGRNLAKPLEAITPTQAAKLGIDDAVISAYSESPSGAAKLVAVTEDSASRIFGSAPRG